MFVVCNKFDVYVIEWVKVCGILCFVCLFKNYENKEVYEVVIFVEFILVKVEFFVLVGYMWLVGLMLFKLYKNCIVNIYFLFLFVFFGIDVIG